MYQLSFFNLSGDALQDHKTFYDLMDALEFGRKSGRYFDIYDTRSARTLSWNELYWQTDEEDWYYDEFEMIWKKGNEQETGEELCRIVNPLLKSVA